MVQVMGWCVCVSVWVWGSAPFGVCCLQDLFVTSTTQIYFCYTCVAIGYLCLIVINFIAILYYIIPVRMLAENKVLTSLRLQYCGLGPEVLIDVCDVIRMNTTLTSLDLSQNTFDEQSIPSLGMVVVTNGFMVLL